MNQDLELSRVIASARDVAHAGTACRRVAAALGFEHFLYGLRIAVGVSRPCQQLVLSGYPEDWSALYDEQGYMMIDPVLARGATAIAPFGWDELERDQPATQRLFQDAARFGLAHGLTVPVHCVNGEFGIMSFAREQALPGGATRIRLFQRAQWLVTHIHARMRELIMEDEKAAAAALTMGA